MFFHWYLNDLIPGPSNRQFSDSKRWFVESLKVKQHEGAGVLCVLFLLGGK